MVWEKKICCEEFDFFRDVYPTLFWCSVTSTMTVSRMISYVTVENYILLITCPINFGEISVQSGHLRSQSTSYSKTLFS